MLYRNSSSSQLLSSRLFFFACLEGERLPVTMVTALILPELPLPSSAGCGRPAVVKRFECRLVHGGGRVRTARQWGVWLALFKKSVTGRSFYRITAAADVWSFSELKCFWSLLGSKVHFNQFNKKCTHGWNDQPWEQPESWHTHRGHSSTATSVTWSQPDWAAFHSDLKTDRQTDRQTDTSCQSVQTLWASENTETLQSVN